jgi:hypothetical protein
MPSSTRDKVLSPATLNLMASIEALYAHAKTVSPPKLAPASAPGAHGQSVPAAALRRTPPPRPNSGKRKPASGGSRGSKAAHTSPIRPVDDVLADMPAWLLEADVERRRGVAAHSGAVLSGIRWGETARLLEENAALEGLLVEQRHTLESTNLLLEEARGEARAEAARAVELEARNAEVVARLEEASEEVRRLERSELSTQVQLAQRQHDKAELAHLLAVEKERADRRVRTVTREAEEALSRATLELRRENDALRTELASARMALAGGVLGVLATKPAVSPAPPPARRKVLAPKAQSQGGTPDLPSGSSYKAHSVRAQARAYERLLTRVEAVLDDKENQLKGMRAARMQT